MPIPKYIQSVGYGEMYELAEGIQKENTFGKFVWFDENCFDRVTTKQGSDLVGVASPNYVSSSDNLQEWSDKYAKNEYNDVYVSKQTIAKSKMEYDEREEMEYIKTYPSEEYLPIINPDFDESQIYVQRINRKNWINVTILGKCIVKDDGNCLPGLYCRPSEGGIAVPTNPHDLFKYYVISRISPTTIQIFLK